MSDLYIGKKVLFVCQYFYPEVFRGNDIAFHLAEKGCDVHVVTGVPNYPIGAFFPGYGIFKKRKEVIKGVSVTRLPIIPRGNGGKIMLMMNYLSFLVVSCFWVLLHSITNKYDLVFCQQLSPITMSAPAVLYKKLRKVPLYTWVLDIWPESLTAAGGIKNKFILGFFNWFVKIEYKYSDKILMSSNSFQKSILTYGNYQEKLVYFPQWSDCDKFSKEFNLPELPNGFKIMFAGAIGDAHGMECNMQAALLTKEYKHIHWIILGDGRKLEWIKNFVKENELTDTVHVLGRFPSETMPLFFEKADAMLVSLTDSPLFNLYAPAKISSYMSSGRPIIAVLNGEGRDVVKLAECGWCVNAGDAEELARVVLNISSMDKSDLIRKGLSGLKYYNNYFEKSKSLDKFDEIIGLKKQ